jgi:Domain of Unknown Function (DUF1080)
VRSIALPLLIVTVSAAGAQEREWPVHSMDRPAPPVVDPGPFAGSQPPPSDAIVLFGGAALDDWRSADDPARPAGWRVVDGAMEVVPGTGAIATAASFGDVQLHIEWRAPTPPAGEGQDRGNSGVFLMGRYEVQVLDSHRSATYPDGQAAALYGQFPPLVNASRPPGEWQTYDIIFRRPRFDSNGGLVQPARMTVLHNGVLVHDNVALHGATRHMERATYEAHPDRLPVSLQDHGAPVRFRNVWIRDLER